MVFRLTNEIKLINTQFKKHNAIKRDDDYHYANND